MSKKLYPDTITYDTPVAELFAVDPDKGEAYRGHSQLLYHIRQRGITTIGELLDAAGENSKEDYWSRIERIPSIGKKALALMNQRLAPYGLKADSGTFAQQAGSKDAVLKRNEIIAGKPTVKIPVDTDSVTIVDATDPRIIDGRILPAGRIYHFGSTASAAQFMGRVLGETEVLRTKNPEHHFACQKLRGENGRQTDIFVSEALIKDARIDFAILAEEIAKEDKQPAVASGRG